MNRRKLKNSLTKMHFLEKGYPATSPSSYWCLFLTLELSTCPTISQNQTERDTMLVILVFERLIVSVESIDGVEYLLADESLPSPNFSLDLDATF